MKKQTDKINELQEQLNNIVKDVHTGKMNNEQVSQKIAAVRNAMDQIINDLKTKK